MYYLILLSLTVQNVLTNEYLYPYPQIYDQQSNEHYKDPISVQNIRYKQTPLPKANPIKVQNGALDDEVHTKYLNNPKQIYKKDSYKSLDDRIQKLKLTIGDPKTPKKKKILFGEIVKTYNKYKDGEHNDYEPNANIERLMEIYLDQRTPKKYKKIYEEIIITYYRNRDLLERTYKNVNMFEDDLNNQFGSEKDNYNPDSEEYESEKDLNDYDIDKLSKRNPRRFVKWLKAWFSKINNSSTTTPAPRTSQLSQLPQTRDTGKQLFIAPTTKPPFTNDLKETEKFKNITEVLQKLNLNIEKQNKLSAIIFQNLYSRISQQHNMNTNRKGHIRFKRDMNSEKNDAKKSTVMNSTLKTNVTEDSKNCTLHETKDDRRVFLRADKTEPNKTSIVKIKLIGYIDEVFAEIKHNIQPLPKIKETYSTNNTYKVGYIMANIEAIVETINRLRSDLYAHKAEWDDNSTFDLFDNVVLSDKIINNLVPKLQLYADS